jgi:uncharacterized repeat protein (TIGR01451 family)
MWGMGKGRGPKGPDDASVRTLFSVLSAREGDDASGASIRSSSRRRSSGRRMLWIGMVVVAVATTFVVIPLASSANPDIAGFELDGNVTDDAAVADDWATLFNASGQSTGAGSALARTFVQDGIGATDTGFAGGQSKDTSDIPGWGWSVGVTPAKDDIANAYAAAYVEQGNEILYFGQERVDTQAGDANMGFWFLQDPTVGKNAGGGFDGKHIDGDVLIQSSLTNGGGVSDIHVFKWQGSGMTEVTGLTEGGCVGGKLGTLNACAFANTGSIGRPWGPNLASPYFYEGGLNLSALFPGQALPCFSSFISNTRTSQSSSAVLKDFAAGSIDTCGSIVIKKVTQPSSAQKFDFTTNVQDNTAFQLADGESRTMSKLNPGTYNVAETAPGPPWSFDSVTCAKGGQYVQKNGAALTINLPLLAQVECTYVNKHDQGYLRLSKAFDPKTSGFLGTFAITYNCGAGDVAVNLPAGGSATVGPFDTGASCSVSEPVLPTAPIGWTFGSPSVSASPVVITKGDQAAAVSVSVTNTISQDIGKLTVVKDFVGAPEGSKVTLQIKSGQTIYPAQVPDGGSTQKTLPTGTYGVGETSAAGDVDLSLYAASVICTKPTGEGTTTVSQNPNGSDVDVAVGKDDDVTCTITNTRKARSISVEKTVSATSDGTYVKAPDVATEPESGGTFYFKVKITNTSVADTITVGSLTDIVGGDTAAVQNLNCGGSLPFTIAHGASVTCTFTRDLNGNAGATETDHVDVAWKDQENVTQSPVSSNDAIIALTDVKPTISVTKTANPTVVQDSGLVTFTAVVTNTSSVDPLTIDTLTDSIYGNLLTGSTKATCTFGGNVVSLPYTIPTGESLVCTFQATVTQTETDVVTSSGTDEEENRVTAHDDATVTVNHTPPPPPPAPKTDVAIQKDATARVTLTNGRATIAYDIRVQNNGPDPAANVTVSDPAPSGVVLTTITQQPSQGSCAIQSGGALLSCTIGTLAVGQSVAIKVDATVSVTGTITNTGTTSTTTPEANVANNTDSAQTVVVAPVTPPTPKPKPKPVPEICNTVDVTPKMLKGNGKAQKIRVTVTKGKTKKGAAGVSVRITGPGVDRTVTAGKNGKISVTVKPTKPGIIRVEVKNAKACNTQRIGVIGVYQPPVTG